MTGVVTQAVHLFNKHKALSLNPVPQKKRKKKEWGGGLFCLTLLYAPPTTVPGT
jgi:hypothetical protein